MKKKGITRSCDLFLEVKHPEHIQNHRDALFLSSWHLPGLAENPALSGFFGLLGYKSESPFFCMVSSSRFPPPDLSVHLSKELLECSGFTGCLSLKEFNDVYGRFRILGGKSIFELSALQETMFFLQRKFHYEPRLIFLIR